MYTDTKPCAVCGSEVRLEPRQVTETPEGQPVGPADGVVGAGDDPVDERVCTNRACSTNRKGDPTP